LETCQAYFYARKLDIEDMMNQTPNPDIIDELNEFYGNNFEILYK
jgi:hypothetical protein